MAHRQEETHAVPNSSHNSKVRVQDPLSSATGTMSQWSDGVSMERDTQPAKLIQLTLASIRAFAALHPQSSSEKATITVVDTALHLIVASILPSNTRTPKVAEDEELGQGFVWLPDAVDEWIDLLSYGTDAVVADNIIIISYIIHILDENIDISRKPRLNAFASYIHSSACQQLSPLVLSLLLALIAYLHPSSSIIPPPTLIHHLSSILLSSSRDSEVTTAQHVLLRSFHLFFPLFPTSKEEQTKTLAQMVIIWIVAEFDLEWERMLFRMEGSIDTGVLEKEERDRKNARVAEIMCEESRKELLMSSIAFLRRWPTDSDRHLRDRTLEVILLVLLRSGRHDRDLMLELEGVFPILFGEDELFHNCPQIANIFNHLLIRVPKDILSSTLLNTSFDFSACFSLLSTTMSTHYLHFVSIALSTSVPAPPLPILAKDALFKHFSESQDTATLWLIVILRLRGKLKAREEMDKLAARLPQCQKEENIYPAAIFAILDVTKWKDPALNSYRFISSLLNLRKSIRAFAALHPQSSSEKATITVVDTALHLIVASILPSNTRTPKVAEDEELGQGFVWLPDAVDEWIDLLSYGTDAVVADNIIIISYIIHILDENIDISRKPRLNAFASYIHSSACQQLSPLVLSLLLALIAYLHPSSSIIPPPTLIHHLSSILLSSSRDSEVTTAQHVLLRSFHLFFPLFPTSKEEQTKTLAQMVIIWIVAEFDLEWERMLFRMEGSIDTGVLEKEETDRKNARMVEIMCEESRKELLMSSIAFLRRWPTDSDRHLRDRTLEVLLLVLLRSGRHDRDLMLELEGVFPILFVANIFNRLLIRVPKDILSSTLLNTSFDFSACFSLLSTTMSTHYVHFVSIALSTSVPAPPLPIPAKDALFKHFSESQDTAALWLIVILRLRGKLKAREEMERLAARLPQCQKEENIYPAAIFAILDVTKWKDPALSLRYWNWLREKLLELLLRRSEVIPKWTQKVSILCSSCRTLLRRISPSNTKYLLQTQLTIELCQQATALPMELECVKGFLDDVEIARRRMKGSQTPWVEWTGVTALNEDELVLMLLAQSRLDEATGTQNSV
ncbi:hypothetical protein BT69DRAFT_1351388 [Atractiella rhizophila]|nr:hypothetical protein BT69DRAFT_1351388 [Atractiella rhizophila]